MNAGRLKLSKRLDEPIVSSAVSHPLFTVCVMFLGVLFLGTFFAFGARLFVFFSLLFCAGLFLCLTRRRPLLRHEFLLSHLFVFALSLALVSECVFTLPNLRREEAFSRTVSDGRQVDFIATVERGTEHGTLLRVEEAEGERVCAYALADLWQAEAGTRFRATAFFSEEEGEHVGELLRVCRGETLFRARIQTELSRVEENTSLLLSFGKELSSRLDVAKCAGYLRAVLLADKSGVDPAFSEVLSASGSSHLLALSGLHLGILIGSLHFVLRALFVPRGVRVVLSVFFALFFLVLCSFPLSLLRAFWMLVVASLTELLRLRQNSGQSLVCAAAIIVFFDAAALFDVGFLLSVFATLGILLFLPAVRESLENSRLWLFLSEKGRFFRFLRRVYAGAVYSFAASFAALTFTAPITLLVFGTFPLFSPLFGVLLVPLFTLLLNVAFLLALLLAAGLPMVHAVARLTDALCALFVQTAEFFSTVSPVLRVENEWAVWAGFSVLFIGVYVCLRYRVRTRTCFLVLPAFLAVVLAASAFC